MAYFNYEIVTGYDNSGSTVNVETLVKYPPKVTWLPLGSTTRTTLGGKRQTDGAKVVLWVFTALPWVDVDNLITTIWTDYDTENAQVTIRTRKRDGTYAYFNAVARLPRTNEEYVQIDETHTRDITISFYIVGSAS
jgi:hypothetical protein